ncbi:MAG: hypothetical protein CMK89_23915 [Pseudomonadales bacterium]|nr:hypothetical protein [Pseudomonadales bacterium]
MSSGLDLAVRTALASVISLASIPAGYSGEKIANDITAMLGAEQSDDLEPISQALSSHKAFSQSLSTPHFKIEPAKPPSLVRTGIFERLCWRSPYSADSGHNPAHRNQDAIAYYWRHGDRPRPTVVVLHGFIASSWTPNEYFLGLSDLYNQGCDIVLKTLPYHGDRRQSTWSLSGLGYVSGGIQHMNHAVVQSTYDVRILVDYLLNQGHASNVGLTGLSLGGYTTALLAGLEPRLAFALPVVPIVSIPDAMMEWKPLDRLMNGIMQQFGLSMTELRKTVAFHSPLAMPVQLPPDKLMIIAGYGDRMASPRHTEALQRHWHGCNVHWFKGSHVLQLGRQEILSARKSFLQGIRFV